MTTDKTRDNDYRLKYMKLYLNWRKLYNVRAAEHRNRFPGKVVDSPSQKESKQKRTWPRATTWPSSEQRIWLRIYPEMPFSLSFSAILWKRNCSTVFTAKNEMKMANACNHLSSFYMYSYICITWLLCRTVFMLFSFF